MKMLSYQLDGQVAVIHLNNHKKLNALTIKMLESLYACCEKIEQDTAVRVVLVTAEGERAFCVGADIGAWSALPPADFARNWVRMGHRVFDRLARLGKPTIAVMNGHAFCGGLELAAACDIRVCAPNVTLALPETGIGIVPGWSGTHRLSRLFPESVLKEMAIFGRRVSAHMAFNLGFVAEVSDDPLAAAHIISEAALAQSPRATEIAKYMIHASVGEDSGAMIEALGGGFIAASEDKSEGVNAFFDKRKPNFPGV